MSFLRVLYFQLPESLRRAITRVRHGRSIKKGTFASPEPEFQRLHEFVHDGDWVIDIGANDGRYTARLSTLVGKTGRVFAFEPVPDTFETLVANMHHASYRNISLFNAAVSEKSDEAMIRIPRSKTKSWACWATLESHEIPEAELDPEYVGIYLMPLDSLTFDHQIAFIKMDIEGHELTALKGMTRILTEHSPTLLVETGQEAVVEFLSNLGYASEKTAGSPNYIFRRRK